MPELPHHTQPIPATLSQARGQGAPETHVSHSRDSFREVVSIDPSSELARCCAGRL